MARDPGTGTRGLRPPPSRKASKQPKLSPPTATVYVPGVGPVRSNRLVEPDRGGGFDPLSVAGRIAKAPLELLVADAVKAAYGARGGQPPGPYRVPPKVAAAAAGAHAATRAIGESALGPQLTNVFEGKPVTSRIGLGADIGLLGIGAFGKAPRLARAAMEAEVAARGLSGAERAAVVERTWERVMNEPGLVAKASHARALRGEARKAAHASISNTVRDPVIRKATKSQVDAHIYQATRGLRGEERQKTVDALYGQMKDAFDLAPEHPVPGFRPVVDEIKGRANVKQAIKAREMFPEVGSGVENDIIHSAHEGAMNGLQVVGEIDPAVYAERLNRALGGDRELGLKLANWYREAYPILHTIFGEDAPAIMRGFAVSQANASPTGGLTAVLTLRDLILQGKPIPRTRSGQALISTVADSIKAALGGEEISKGMAAKLHDFAASLEGRRTRTWTLDDIRAGAPVAVDIHALRDLGQVDPKLLDTLYNRHGINVTHLMEDKYRNELEGLRRDLGKAGSPTERKKIGTSIANKEKQIETFTAEHADEIAAGRESGIVMDNPQSAASGLRYELAAEKYRQITQHLNDVGFWGKTDWTPADVQALGWSVIQRIHGTEPEDLLFAVDRNTYSQALEVLNGKTGMGEGLSYRAQMAVTNEMLPYITRVAEEENAFVRSTTVGPGKWENGAPVASVNMEIVGSPGQVERVLQRTTDLFDQYESLAVRMGVTNAKSKRVLEIRSDAFADSPQTVEAFFLALRRIAPKSLQKHLKGYMPIERDGLHGIRIVTEAPSLKIDELPVWLSKQWEPHIQQAAEEAGLWGDLKYNASNAELRTASTSEVRSRTIYGGAVERPAGVGDPLAAEVHAALQDSIARHTGVTGALRRGAHALAGEEGAFRPGAFLGRRAKPPLRVVPPTEGPRADAIREAADTFNLWKLTNPDADERLQKAVMADIARNNGVDEFGLRQFLANGKIRRATTVEDAVAEVMPEMKRLRAKQDKMVSQARAARANASQDAYDAAGGGMAGHLASLKALEGELPKLTQSVLDHDVLTQEGVERMFSFISTQEHLQYYETVRARIALLDLLNGKVLQPNQTKTLEKIFGQNIPAVLKQSSRSIPHHILMELWNLPRALMSSMDFSAPLRQGLVTAAGHPRLFVRNILPMFKALSKTHYRQMMDEIVGRPTFDLMMRAGLSLPHITSHLTPGEMYWYSHWGEKIPLVAHSQRAYLLFLNKMRADVFDSLVRTADSEGIDLTAKVGNVKEKGLKDVARYVNVATGRGDLNKFVPGIKLENAAEPLATVFFAPRLWASRVNLLRPDYYSQLDPFVRRQAVKSSLSLLAAGTTIASLAMLAGARVNLDPRNSDFGKIRVGNTRLDIWGGFQQNIRVLAQMLTQTYISSATGEKMSLGEGGVGKTTPWDVAVRFARGKAAPTTSVLLDWMFKETFDRKKVDFKTRETWLNEIRTHTLPLLGQDIFNVWKEYKWLGVLATILPGVFGVGVQSYPPPTPKKTRTYLRPPSGGGLGGGGMGAGLGGGGLGG